MLRSFVIAALVSALPASALAQGVTRQRPEAEVVVWSGWPGTTLSNGSDLGGVGLSADRGVRITGVSIRVVVGGGGGAGTSTVVITDGTNTCTATFTCAATATLGTYRVTPSGTAGTGCTYAPGALLSASVGASTCTTTQPNVRSLVIGGRRL